MEYSDWEGCYRDQWQGILIPESFAHPAKVSRGLARHIYEHILEEGWAVAGDVVVDPFAGIGGFAFHAMANGLCFEGVELEQKFVDLGKENITLWNDRYSDMPKWSSAAVILQGDSRRFCEVVEGAGLCVSSPPWEDGVPCQDPNYRTGRTAGGGPLYGDYGTHPGNLGNMRPGSHALAVSSPPFGEGETRDRSPVSGGNVADCITRAYTQDRQGTTPGNLAAMSVSSPPWEGCLQNSLDGSGLTFGNLRYGNEDRRTKEIVANYGASPGQLGGAATPDFWTAARAIVEQVYLVLRPGGHAVWVTKRFVRKGEIVDFPGQWRELCESVGFVTLHEHRAMLVEDRGAQYDLFGNLEKREIKRASFFRRLYESKYPENAIDWETIHCMVKPTE